MVMTQHHYLPTIRAHLTRIIGDDEDSFEGETSTSSVVMLAQLLVESREKLEEDKKNAPTLIECFFYFTEPPYLVNLSANELTFDYKGKLQTKRILDSPCHWFEPEIAYFIGRLELDEGVQMVAFVFHSKEENNSRLEVSFDLLATPCRSLHDFLEQLYKILFGVIEELEQNCP